MKKKKPTLADRILKTLATVKNGANSDRLARRVRAKTGSVSSACSRLVRAGKLKRIDGGTGRGTEAVWALV